MKEPIIVADSGDILIFESLTKAERFLEPHIIDDAKQRIYDSEGRLLKFTTEKGIRAERAILHSVEEKPSHALELRSALVLFFTARRQSRLAIESFTQ